MKIERFFLRAVGPFTNEELHFEQGDYGLHLVVGNNEAGKSSTLRAFHYFFWGFPPRVDDDFVHPYKNLRIGATLCDDRGAAQTFFRRKAKTNSLRDEDDQQPVDEGQLRQLLGSVDETLFSTAFGIDHPTLVAGGEAVAQGRGDVGEVLFSGSGVASLHAARQQLRDDCETLFLPRGSNPRINSLLNELKQMRVEFRGLPLLPRQWESCRQEYEQAKAHRSQEESRLRTLKEEAGRLSRLLAALKLISQRDQWSSQLEKVRDAVLLSPEFREERQRIEQQLREATTDLRHAGERLRRDEQKDVALDACPQLLTHQVNIEGTFKRLGVYEQCQVDRPKRAAELNACEQAALECLNLQVDTPLSEALKLAVPSAQRVRIQELTNCYQAIKEDVERCRTEYEDLKSSAQELELALQQTAQPRDTDVLERMLHESLAPGDLDSQYNDLHREVTRIQERVRIDQQKLPFWSGEAAALEELPVPSVETIELFQTEIDSCQREVEHRRRTGEQQAEQAAELRREIEQIRLQHDVPTEERLRESRLRRDQLWTQVQEVWLREGEQDEEETKGDATSSKEELADSFQRAMEEVDQISDRLRREAERVATHAQLCSRLNDCTHKQQALQRQLEDEEQLLEAHYGRWQRAWNPTGIDPATPREMLAWVRQQKDLTDRLDVLRDKESQLRDVAQDLVNRKRVLSDELNRIAAPALADQASLQEIVHHAREVMELARHQKQEQQRLRDRLSESKGNLNRSRTRQQLAEEKWARWEQDWADAIRHLPVDEQAKPNEVSRVLEIIDELTKQLEQARRIKEERLQQIDESRRRFEEDVRELTARLGSDLEDERVEHAISQIHSRLTDAVRAAAEKTELTESIAKQRKELETHQICIDKLREHLSALCQQAGCESETELAAAEERSQLRRKLEDDLQKIDHRLCELSGGQTLEAFVFEAREEDTDSLQPRLEQIETEIEILDTRIKDELGPEQGRKEQVYRQMDSGARAAEVAERTADVIAAISGEAEQYARTRLALAVLERGIEWYRQRHQGPLVRRAGELFAQLTCDSFSGLQVDYGSDGKPELLAVRGGRREAVSVNGLSDGTADQLYLAFRLSWLENYLEEHEPVPLIVDDILMRFDNARSIETLRVLADLSAKTQIIFFTHHEHLVELAESCLDPDTCFVHRLPNVAVATN